jgi:hypothetical protein
MADTQRDGRDGRTNGGSADRPDKGPPLRVPTRVPWWVESPAEWGPGATTAALFGQRFWLLLLGLLDDLPFLPTGTGRPVVAGSKHPEVYLRLSENGSVMHRSS